MLNLPHMSRLECCFACPSNTYDSCVVTPDAQTVYNPKNFNDKKINAAGASGCLIKVFPSSYEYPDSPMIGSAADITCVGPDSPDCPLIKIALIALDDIPVTPEY